MQSLSKSQARRVALSSQGFNDRPQATPTMRTLERTVARTGVLQLDSVNVLVRAHQMPLYSRMGPYDVDLLRRAAESRPRRLVEYDAHVQAFMPVELWPLMAHRRDRYRARRGRWGMDTDVDLVPTVMAMVSQRGPVTARDLESDLGGERDREHWGWNWSQARKVLDYLCAVGEVAIAGRNAQFEIRYDLTERVLPARVLEMPVPTATEAVTELVRRAAISHGVATERCLADYYRLNIPGNDTQPGARAAIAELVAAGELEQVRVQGWERVAYLHREAKVPRKVAARTLLSPFDPVVWERDRTEALFDFHYRIEIYTPAAKRVHGYYVLPFLLGEQIVARVDLKADRATGTLLVKAAHGEPSAPQETAAELAAELARMAGWLGLGSIVVEPRGDLAAALTIQLGA